MPGKGEGIFGLGAGKQGGGRVEGERFTIPSIGGLGHGPPSGCCAAPSLTSKLDDRIPE